MIETPHQTEVELGNGWEVAVEIEVVELSPGHPGNPSRDPDRYDPGEAAWVELGKITATEEVEELGLKSGQEIHPAFLLGGQAALTKLERDLAYDLERGYFDDRGDYGYEGPDEPDVDDYYEPGW